MRGIIFIVLLNMMAPLHPAQASPQEEADAYHRDFQTAGEGVVIGNAEGVAVSFGQAGHLKLEGPPIDPDTLFEIGSITKVFTGILLADAVIHGKAALDDPISKHLPADLLAGKSPLHAVTLLELATHTSGLPRLPANLEAGSDPNDPYAHYSVEKLHACLRDFKSTDFEKRGELNYSNLGMGLLGHLLERISGKPYEVLIQESIFSPLGMTASFIQRVPGVVPAEMRNRFATGHNCGRTVGHWHIDSLCGAGAMVSSARDVMVFAQAHWSPGTPEPLQKAMALAAKPQRNGVGLGWFISEDGLHHDGGTGGFRTELHVNPEKQSASLKFLNSTGPANDGVNIGDFQPLSGYWEGTLDTGSSKLRLLLRISAEGRIVMHSLDQGGVGMPAAKAVFNNEKLSVMFSSIGGKFDGKLEGDTISGQWHQGRDFPLVLTKRANLPDELVKSLKRRASGDLSEVAGFWSGYLGGDAGLFLILEIESFDGTGEARMFSPDQTPEAIALNSFSFDGKSLTLAIEPLKASYTASLNPAGELSGSWKQGPQPQPLVLKRSRERPERK